MRIGSRPTVLIAALVVIATALSVYLLYNEQQHVAIAHGQLIAAYDTLERIESITIALRDAESARLAFITTSDESFNGEYRQHITQIDRLLDNLSQLDNHAQLTVSHMRDLTERWITTVDAATKRGREILTHGQVSQLATSSRQIAQLRESLASAQIEQRQKLYRVTQQFQEATLKRNREFQFFLLGFGLLVLLVSTIPIYYVPRQATEKKGRMSLQLALTHRLTRARNERGTAEAALAAVCEGFDFACGAVWLLDRETHTLYRLATWSRPALEGSEFITMSEAARLSIDDRFPACVMQSLRHKWLSDVISEQNFWREQAARRAKLHSALALPIVSGSAAVGLIEFFSQRRSPEAEETIEMLGFLSEELGQTLAGLESRRQLEESAKLAVFTAEASTAITTGQNIDSVLRQCTDLAVRHLNAALARIWILEPGSQTLVLRSSSGMYTHTDGQHSRIQVGKLKIGKIASERSPHLTNDLTNDDWVSDPEWVRREGLAAFAGYPLIVDNLVVGVLAIFARQKLTVQALSALGSVANGLAVSIKHKQAEEQLLASERLFRQLAENIKEVFFVLKPGPQLLYVSPTYDQLWGRSRADLIARPWSLLDGIVKEDRKNVLNFIRSNTFSETKSGIEFRVQRPDGSERWVWLKAFGQFGENGRWTISYIVAHDITERKESESRINDFFSVVSHELRTPLTSIHASLKLLNGGLGGPLSDKGARLVSIASHESDRLIRLINDILDLRKMEAGKLDFKIRQSSIKRLLELSVAGVKGMAEEAMVKIASPGNLDGLVWCDEDRIVQVLENLLSNAIKFSGPGETVSVVPEFKNNCMRISIVDHGPGIAARSISKLFGKFQQLDSSDHRAKGGTGLGLAISKTIVEQHKGQIGVISQEGSGSTFWFELPIACELPEVTQAHVLIASTDDQLIRDLQQILPLHGFTSAQALTMKELRTMLSEKFYRAVLIDLDSVEAGGLEQMLCELPVVAPLIGVTASQAPLADQAGRFSCVIKKPVTEHDLTHAIKLALLRARTGSLKILIVDPDEASRELLRQELQTAGLPLTVSEACNGEAAIYKAAKEKPDLIILEVECPDLSRAQLIERLKETGLASTALLVYSCRDLTEDERSQTRLGRTRYLTKSKTTDRSMIAMIAELLDEPAAGAGSKVVHSHRVASQSAAAN